VPKVVKLPLTNSFGANDLGSDFNNDSINATRRQFYVVKKIIFNTDTLITKKFLILLRQKNQPLINCYKTIDMANNIPCEGLGMF